MILSFYHLYERLLLSSLANKYCALKFNQHCDTTQTTTHQNNPFTKMASIFSYFNQISKEIVKYFPVRFDVDVVQHCKLNLKAQYSASIMTSFFSRTVFLSPYLFFSHVFPHLFIFVSFIYFLTYSSPPSFTQPSFTHTHTQTHIHTHTHTHTHTGGYGKNTRRNIFIHAVQ